MESKKKEKEIIADMMSEIAGREETAEIAEAEETAEAAEIVKTAEAAEIKEKTRAKKNRKKRGKLIRRIIFFVIVLLAAGALIYSRVRAAGAVPTYSTVEVTRGDLKQTMNSSGRVQSEEVCVYYANVESQVQSVRAKAGDIVHAGDVLLTYDTSEIELTKQKAELERDIKDLQLKVQTEKSNKEAAETAAAIVNMQTLDAQIARIEGEIDQIHGCMTANSNWKETTGAALGDEILDLEGKITKAEGKLETETDPSARKKLKKKRDNYEEELEEKRDEARSHSNNDLEEYLRQKQEELGKLKELRSDNKAEYESSKEQILTGTEKSQIQKERELADLTGSSAAIDLEKANQGVVAGFDGIITNVKVTDGARTAPGAELFTLENTEKVKMTMQVSRFDLEYIKMGQKAELEIAGHDYTGTIVHIDKAASVNDAGASVIEADIHIDDPDEYIYLGVDAKATILVAERQNVLTVPVEVINMDKQGYYCYVIRDGVIKRVDLKLGISSDTMTEILEGLEEGDLIIEAGSEELIEGSPAAPVISEEADANAAGSADNSAAVDGAEENEE